MDISSPKCICCESTNSLITCNENTICSDCFQNQMKVLELYDLSRSKSNPEINEVIKGKLYIGNYDFAKDKAKMKEKGITHVLVCGAELKSLFQEDFIYKKFDIRDCIEQSIINYFVPSIQFINESTTCLVHCYAGVSRSATIVIAYLMSCSIPSPSYKEASEYLKTIRPYIHPNDNFVKELIQFEKRKK